MDSDDDGILDKPYEDMSLSPVHLTLARHQRPADPRPNVLNPSYWADLFDHGKISEEEYSLRKCIITAEPNDAMGMMKGTLSVETYLRTTYPKPTGALRPGDPPHQHPLPEPWSTHCSRRARSKFRPPDSAGKSVARSSGMKSGDALEGAEQMGSKAGGASVASVYATAPVSAKSDASFQSARSASQPSQVRRSTQLGDQEGREPALLSIDDPSLLVDPTTLSLAGLSMSRSNSQHSTKSDQSTGPGGSGTQ